MDARTYLRRPQRLRADITILQERIENLRVNMLPKAVNYDKDPVQTSPHDPMPEFAVKIDELNRELYERWKEFEASIDDITNTINKIEDDDVRSIMAQRYLGKKPWRVIERDMFVCEREVYYMHRKGLRAVEKIITEKESLQLIAVFK